MIIVPDAILKKMAEPERAEKPEKPKIAGGDVPHKAEFEKDVVYLYQFIRTPVIPSPSPFCLKVETYLRMSELKYENVDHKMKFRSKKGQLPFVEINGAEINDSENIIKELEKHFSKDIDNDLTQDQKIISHALTSMLNNHTSWVCRWWRWKNPSEFIKTAQIDLKKSFNSKLPKGLLNFFFKINFKSNSKHVVNHGLGRNTSEEIISLGKSDLKSLSDFLSDKPYFFGEEPHLLDCVAFANLCQFLYVPFSGFKEYIETDCPNLLTHIERMKNRYWHDWEETCSSLDLNSHLPKKEPEETKEEPSKEEALKKEEAEAKEAEKKEDIKEVKDIEKTPEIKEGGDADKKE